MKRTYVVTGAASGIGAASADRLAGGKKVAGSSPVGHPLRFSIGKPDTRK